MKQSIFFYTEQSDLQCHNGKSVVEIEPLNEELYDKNDVGPMHSIVLEDGTKLQAFDDELYMFRRDNVGPCWAAC